MVKNKVVQINDYIFINEWRSWNSFTWRFLSTYYVSPFSISLSMLGNVFPQSTKTTTFVCPVYPERAEGPSLCLCDSCESQHDLILWRVAKLHLDSNWADFVDVWFFCPSSVWCIESVCAAYYMPENKKINRPESGLDQNNIMLCSLFEVSWDESISPATLFILCVMMHVAIYYILKFEL